ncbi:hypothetical protein AAMO2058_000514800 [Amorphochlora amoebiformis]
MVDVRKWGASFAMMGRTIAGFRDSISRIDSKPVGRLHRTEIATQTMAKKLTVEADRISDATKFHEACEKGQRRLVVKLMRKGANVHQETKGGWTPLHFACRSPSLEVAKLLLDKKADPNASSSTGDTPLHVAASAGKASFVTLLLEYGASVLAEDDHGSLPMNQAAASWLHRKSKYHFTEFTNYANVMDVLIGNGTVKRSNMQKRVQLASLLINKQVDAAWHILSRQISLHVEIDGYHPRASMSGNLQEPVISHSKYRYEFEVLLANSVHEEKEYFQIKEKRLKRLHEEQKRRIAKHGRSPMLIAQANLHIDSGLASSSHETDQVHNPPNNNPAPDATPPKIRLVSKLKVDKNQPLNSSPVQHTRGLKRIPKDLAPLAVPNLDQKAAVHPNNSLEAKGSVVSMPGSSNRVAANRIGGQKKMLACRRHAREVKRRNSFARIPSHITTRNLLKTSATSMGRTSVIESANGPLEGLEGYPIGNANTNNSSNGLNLKDSVAWVIKALEDLRKEGGTSRQLVKSVISLMMHQEESVKLFSLPLVKAYFDIKWQDVRTIFVILAIIHGVFLICISTLASTIRISGMRFTHIFLQACVLLISIGNAVIIGLSLKSMEVRLYLTSSVDWVQVLLAVPQAIGHLSKISQVQDIPDMDSSSSQWILWALALTNIIAWIRIAKFLMPFTEQRLTIVSVLGMVRAFGTVVAFTFIITILTFSFLFFVWFRNEEVDRLDSWEKVLVELYFFALGSMENYKSMVDQMSNISTISKFQVLFILYTAIVFIAMNNWLIALMIANFNEMKEHSEL